MVHACWSCLASFILDRLVYLEFKFMDNPHHATLAKKYHNERLSFTLKPKVYPS
jgi:hypothetical protein